MKKYIFYFLFTVFFTQNTYAMDNPISDDELRSVRQINKTLYVAKVQGDLFFVMEKLQPENRQAWLQYVENQYHSAVDQDLTKDIDQLLADTYLDKSCTNINIVPLKFRYNLNGNDNPYCKKIRPILDGDGGTFGSMIHFNKLNQDACPTYETWIAYALSTRQTPCTFCTLETLPHIELCFTVNTEKDAPFTSHMGIQRSRLYIKNYLKEELQNYRYPTNELMQQFPWHSNLSIPLHAFAAKVMNLYSPQKIYMITTPMINMRNILIKALPEDSIWIGHSRFHEMLNDESVSKYERLSRKNALWSRSDREEMRKEIQIYGPYMDKILAKNYSPIKITGECMDADSETGPLYWEELGSIPSDFTWTLFDQHKTPILQFDSSSLDFVLKKYKWFFMGHHMQSGLYVIVDLKKLGSQF